MKYMVALFDHQQHVVTVVVKEKNKNTGPIAHLHVLNVVQFRCQLVALNGGQQKHTMGKDVWFTSPILWRCHDLEVLSLWNSQ